jgi:hypothetical protein
MKKTPIDLTTGFNTTVHTWTPVAEKPTTAATSTTDLTMATPISQLDTSTWQAKAPLQSKYDPTTCNCYLEGGTQFFSINEPITGAAIDPDLTADERAAAISDMCVILSDSHIHGGNYSQPSDDSQTILVKIPDSSIVGFKKLEQWVIDTTFAKQEAWGLRTASLDTITDRLTPILRPKKEETDGNAITIKVLVKKCDIFIQSPDNPRDFDPSGTTLDILKGSKVAIVGEVKGIRIKQKELAAQTFVARKIYVFAHTGSTAPDGFDDGLGINIMQAPSFASKRATPPQPAPPSALPAASASPVAPAETSAGAAAVITATNEVTPSVAAAAEALAASAGAMDVDASTATMVGA